MIGVKEQVRWRSSFIWPSRKPKKATVESFSISRQNVEAHKHAIASKQSSDPKLYKTDTRIKTNKKKKKKQGQNSPSKFLLCRSSCPLLFYFLLFFFSFKCYEYSQDYSFTSIWGYSTSTITAFSRSSGLVSPRLGFFPIYRCAVVPLFSFFSSFWFLDSLIVFIYFYFRWGCFEFIFLFVWSLNVNRKMRQNTVLRSSQNTVSGRLISSNNKP